MTSVLFGILEVAGHPSGEDARRILRRIHNALQDLRTATINGHDVLAIIDADQGAKPITVDHYGYNNRCRNGCDHEPVPWGVQRYFGINLVVSGNWDILNAPLRYWVNSDAQIDLTGKVLVHQGKRNPLKEAQP